MRIFSNWFKTPKEKKEIEVLSKKPSVLMHTSAHKPDKVGLIRPIFNKEVNKNSVFATDSEKLALLYALQPFFSFRFGKNNQEIGVILLGTDHDLLKIDNRTAYIYYVDSLTFSPVIKEDGYYENEWTSDNEVYVKKDTSPREVHFIDILRNGIQVFWVNNIDTLNEIDKEIISNEITTGEKKLQYLINQTNWKPDKVIYLNRFRNVCPVQIDSNGKINLIRSGDTL